MDSEGFAVDLGALGAVRNRVGSLAEQLAGPPRDISTPEVFGHTRLAEAVKVFAAQENRGLAWLTGDMESIRDTLAETIKSYQKLDERGAGWFEGLV